MLLYAYLYKSRNGKRSEEIAEPINWNSVRTSEILSIKGQKTTERNIKLKGFSVVHETRYCCHSIFVFYIHFKMRHYIVQQSTF